MPARQVQGGGAAGPRNGQRGYTGLESLPPMIRVPPCGEGEVAEGELWLIKKRRLGGTMTASISETEA